MIVGIVGSRKFDNYEALKAVADTLPAKEIASSGAAGADTLAERYANEKNLPIKIFLPKFKTDPATPYHPGWFHARNRALAEYADVIVACWDGVSAGTKSTIQHAKKIGKQIYLVT